MWGNLNNVYPPDTIYFPSWQPSASSTRTCTPSLSYADDDTGSGSWQPSASSTPTCTPSLSYADDDTSSLSSSSGSAKRKSWSRAEVLALLSSYTERRQEFSNPKTRNKDVWQIISEDMEWKGFTGISGKDCETKFKNLKRAYVNTVDHNNTTGNDRKVCAYYDELHNLFHKDATIAPVVLCSNRRGQTYKQPVSDSTTDAEEMHSDEEIPKKKKKVQTPRGELVSLFREFTKSREESEKQKMSKLEEMHTEKMNVMGRFLQVFEKYAEKE